MIVGIGIILFIIALLLWALKFAIGIAAIFGLVGIVMFIIGLVSSRKGKRSSI
jgi:membrane-bound ClpP family serine protease